MESERRYLQRRALFHRRMAREAACLEAECAHEALVRAYGKRIEELRRKGPGAPPEAEPGAADASRPLRPIVAAEPV